MKMTFGFLFGSQIYGMCIVQCFILFGSSCSSIDIATGYGLDGRGSIPEGASDFSLFYSVQTGSGAHPASYPMGTRSFFPKGKAAWA
jgi:hypothetical protein